MKLKSRIFFLFLVTGSRAFAQLSLPEQDCINAIQLFDTVPFHKEAYFGTGESEDLSHHTCLSWSENNSVWFTFTVENSGTIEFSIIPDSITDYDFAMFDLTNSCCDDLHSADPPEVRCNVASTYGQTGLKTGYTEISSGSFQDSFLAPLNVVGGETYALLIDRFYPIGVGFTLDFSNTTAMFSDSIKFFSGVTAVNITGIAPFTSCYMPRISQFIIFLSKEIKSSSLNSDGSDFTLIGPSDVSISDVDYYGGFVNEIHFDLLGALGDIWSPGNYTIIMHGNLLESYCGIITSDTFNFTIPELVTTRFSYSIQEGCNADTVTFTNQSIGNGLTYLWHFGNGETSTDKDPTVIYNSQQLFYVTLKAINGTCADSIVKNIDVRGTCLHEFNGSVLSEGFDFELFPNPSNGKVKLVLHEPDFSKMDIEIFNVIGSRKLNKHYSVIQNEIVLDLGNWEQGIYVLRLASGSAITSKKFTLLH